MLSPTLPVRYHVFGVNPPSGYTLLVDYILDDPEQNRLALLERIQHSNNRTLSAWQARELLQPDDVFDIECVSGQQDAQLAVEFWRAYFRAQGETVIEADHLWDSLA